ncbi:CDP-glycerol glycerophosphotransferase family protein [Brevibacterium sp. CS2]|uniref:CDP-glycerol glycerophosphotransferase family protein n=1 Tax=Brevibacterium sp. CS2 TaxID=2575923 RepID=UPI0020C8276C|nr:CDP-glycerol glycerophosphotransferase family protein [Brevibacterium sp. CS2]
MHTWVRFDRSVAPYARVHIDRISLGGERFRLDGRIYSRHSELERAVLVLTGRVTGTRLRVPAVLTPDLAGARGAFGLRRWTVTAQAPLDTLFDDPELVDDTFDAWLESKVAGAAEVHRSRVGRNRYLVRLRARPGEAWIGQRRVSIVPYFTVKARNLSFTVEVFDRQAFAALRQPARRPDAGEARPVWLVGEMPFRAQDTGLAFFRHVADTHPEIDVRYVIDPRSPERANLAGYEDRIVDHRSAEHVRLTLAAERIIGSHHPDYLYPSRRPDFVRRISAVRVFLQHGVMGMKWMTPTYGRSAPGFDTDLFIASSEREKRMLVEDFGYAPDDIAVTGLSRFDTLFDDSLPVRPQQVLILPTWRDWLTSPEAVSASEFTAAWRSLLSSPRLAELRERYGLDIVFGLHPNMRQFIGEFADLPVRVFVQGEVRVQDLLRQSGMMITDYSSAGLDFSFLHRTLVYYQFDRERFFRGTRSHFDLETELPGPVRFDESAVLDEIERHYESGGVTDPEYIARADALVAHRDRGSSERIVDAVRAATRTRTPLDLVHHEAVQAGWRRIRRSRAYFPLMRRMFRLARRLPADDALIVFESEVGRQYADSPRAIHEELVRRGDTRRKVWIHRGPIPVTDAHTTVVERLSPAYFWHLARARYWVNNQNFPFYITRRRNGVYLQTWHGTPLKRMQHDLDAVVGRDEGYLSRVSRATAQWTHLVSPSPYASAAFASAFRHRAEVLELGYPRNDVLRAPDRDAIRASVRERLGIPEDRTVVLYAPTFRDDANVGGNRFDFALALELDPARFAADLGAEFTLLLRMHVVVRHAAEIPEDAAEAVLDVSSYPDIQELFLAADVLVTDYSSVFFDYAILRRPMVFYAYDLERYRDDLRGFYLDYEAEVPGPVVRTEDELYAALRRIGAELAAGGGESAARAAEFARRFAPHDDGRAAARVVDAAFGAVPPAVEAVPEDTVPEEAPAEPAGDAAPSDAALSDASVAGAEEPAAGEE